MKRDLDRLMDERGMNAFIVFGEARNNYPLRYLTNGAPITGGIVLKKVASDPILICSAMEREEAQKSGLHTLAYSDFNLPKLVKDTGSYFDARVLMIAYIFERYQVEGDVGFYGMADPGYAFEFLNRVSEVSSRIRVRGETENTLFDAAYITKDSAELAAIRSVAERTNNVMQMVIEFIQTHQVQGERVIKADGAALTIGDVKRYMRAQLIENGLEDAEGTIFAQGRDAALPHSRGEDADALVLGKSIVFDLFPRETGGGYFHDMTRTFCLGFAPTEVAQAYDEVMQAFNAVIDALEVGENSSAYQTMVCDIFEKTGHKTPRSHPGTEDGYVHSLGHGIGLEIHAAPRFSSVSGQVLEPNMVFTIEPGLYYPDRGFGIRVEDTVYVDENGEFHSLTYMPKDLVIPMQG